MKNRISLMVGLLGLALPLVACSSGDGSSSGGGGSPIPQELSAKYCTGTLTAPAEYLLMVGAGTAVGDGSTLPAGTPVLVSGFFDPGDEAIAFVDGTPAEVVVELGGVESECDLSNVSTSDAVNVVLATSTIHENEDLSGQSCSIPVGQTFGGFSYGGGGDVASFSFSNPDPDLECAVTKGYTGDLKFADLFPRQLGGG